MQGNTFASKNVNDNSDLGTIAQQEAKAEHPLSIRE